MSKLWPTSKRAPAPAMSGRDAEPARAAAAASASAAAAAAPAAAAAAGAHGDVPSWFPSAFPMPITGVRSWPQLLRPLPVKAYTGAPGRFIAFAAAEGAPAHPSFSLGDLSPAAMRALAAGPLNLSRPARESVEDEDDGSGAAALYRASPRSNHGGDDDDECCGDELRADDGTSDLRAAALSKPAVSDRPTLFVAFPPLPGCDDKGAVKDGKLDMTVRVTDPAAAAALGDVMEYMVDVAHAAREKLNPKLHERCIRDATAEARKGGKAGAGDYADRLAAEDRKQTRSNMTFCFTPALEKTPGSDEFYAPQLKVKLLTSDKTVPSSVVTKKLPGAGVVVESADFVEYVAQARGGYKPEPPRVLGEETWLLLASGVSGGYGSATLTVQRDVARPRDGVAVRVGPALFAPNTPLILDIKFKIHAGDKFNVTATAVAAVALPVARAPPVELSSRFVVVPPSIKGLPAFGGGGGDTTRGGALVDADGFAPQVCDADPPPCQSGAGCSVTAHCACCCVFFCDHHTRACAATWDWVRACACARPSPRSPPSSAPSQDDDDEEAAENALMEARLARSRRAADAAAAGAAAPPAPPGAPTKRGAATRPSGAGGAAAALARAFEDADDAPPPPVVKRARGPPPSASAASEYSQGEAHAPPAPPPPPPPQSRRRSATAANGGGGSPPR